MKLGSKTYNITATVLRVVDGDTLECEVDCLFDIKTKLIVRMFGINANEINDKNESKKQEAKAAKEWLKIQVEGKLVYLKTYKDKEKFGRYLAEVFMSDPNVSTEQNLEQLSINKQMILQGLAKPYYGSKRE